MTTKINKKPHITKIAIHKAEPIHSKKASVKTTPTKIKNKFYQIVNDVDTSIQSKSSNLENAISKQLTGITKMYDAVKNSKESKTVFKSSYAKLHNMIKANLDFLKTVPNLAVTISRALKKPTTKKSPPKTIPPTSVKKKNLTKIK